ncbi:Inner membrane protein YqjA [Caulifigura coniformis]|uniref:Inner membrane protein YqjA n=1 Tax=Caulifigura coniformis TaxID=2527983 RepID=A0A517SKI0_9PLAN|nr:DedA family protein [Caulifigura coniformis]QDT56632.1 Inner membrane protein YqjA [Caulifigura coniformis]
MWELLEKIVYTIFHLNVENVTELTQLVGPWLYVILFVIIFCETGLVALPFLPGDSLLFTVGAVAGLSGSTINLPLMGVLLFIAAVLGDAVNYSIGYRVGPAVFRSEESRWFSKKHLVEAQRFYEKYGAKTIVIARFVPIVRTFAPFVAGIGKMNYWRFAVYNVFGAAIWISLFLVAGWWLGAKFKDNLKIIIYGILVVSVLPIVYEVWNARRLKKAAQKAAQSPPAV